MDWKKIGQALLFPHIAVLLLMFLIGTVLLIYTMLFLEETNPLRTASYVLAFYTLTIWCVRIKSIIDFFLRIKNKNKHIQTWLNNPRLRMNVTLTANVLWNSAYAVLQLGLGIYHKSAWFYSLAAYYCSLAVMRFFLVRHTLHHRPGEKMQQELKHYQTCGWIFLFMNLALSGMIFYMIYENRMVCHNEITTIAMAAYTFISLGLAIVNVVRYRKYHSPVMSASKVISLAAACVSMLTLENTMLATFSKAEMTLLMQKRFLGISGAAISVIIIIMAIYMIVQSKKKMKCMEN